jgi:hypothetical protein
MASINASTAGVGGVITTSDNTGNLNIQSGGSTKIAVTSAGVTVTGTLSASGGITKASLPAGSVLQVVNATYSTQVTSSSATWATTGLTATITPTSATSKILVFVSQTGLYKNAFDTYMGLRLLRNSTVIVTFERQALYTGSTAKNEGASSTNYLDSPATTSALTYSTEFNNMPATGVVYAQVSSPTGESSTITLMEIAA